MTEVKTCSEHPSSMAERIEKRLRPSNDAAHADVVKQVGHSPTKTVTSIHHSRNLTYGEGNAGEGDVDGNKRGTV